MANLGASSLGLGISFSLQDLFTNTSKAIRGEMSKLTVSTKQMVGETTTLLQSIGSVKVLAGATAILAPMGAFLNMSAKLSDELANVQKTTGLTNSELDSLRKTLEGMDTRTSLSELLKIGAVGGKLGVAKNELEGFIKVVDRAVVALGDEFTGGAEQVGDELGKIKNLFASTKNLDFGTALNNIGSALNELGNAGASSAPNIAQFAQRIGQLGTLAPSLSETFGLGATLEELGLSAEIAAGGITNIMTVAGENIGAFASQMNMGVQATRDLINTDPNAFLVSLTKSFAGMDNASVIEAMKKMKIGSQESMKVVLGLANNTELLAKRQQIAAKAMQEGTSLTKEFDVKNNTLQANIEKLTGKLSILGQKIGDALIPVFTVFAVAISLTTDVLLALVQNPVGAFLIQLTALLAIGAAAWAIYNLAIKPAIVSMQAFSAQIKATLITAAPLIQMALPFILLAGVIKKGVEAFDSFNGVVGTGFTLFLQQVGGVVRGIQEIAASWDNVSETFTLSKGMAQSLQQLGILDFVVSLGTWVVRFIELFKGFWEGLKSIFSTIGRILKFTINLFSPVISLFNLLMSIVSKNTTEVKLWAEAGRLAGMIIGAALAFIALKFVILGATALVAMLPVITVLTLIGLAIWGVIKVGQWLINKFTEIWAMSTGFLDFGKNIVLAIWEGVKSMWGAFTGWLSSAIKNIPVVGRFFQDEAATTTNTQLATTQNKPESIGNAMAMQKGFMTPQQQQAGVGVLQNSNQKQEINILVDGSNMAKVVADKNSIEQARE